MIKFPIIMLKTYHHQKEKSYRGSTDCFGNGMIRGSTWKGVNVAKKKKNALKESPYPHCGLYLLVFV